MTVRRAALLLALLALGGGVSSPSQASDEGCSANAGSFAEVVEGSRGRGPIVSRPSSLCADVERRAPNAVDVQVVVSPPSAEVQEGGRRGAGRR